MSQDYITVTYSEKRTPKSHYPQQLIDYLVQRFNLREGSKLVEIGCGRGDFLKAFAERGFYCFGLDREESAKSFSPNLEIHTCDINEEPLPFDDNSVDIVYHKSLIEHMYSPDILMKETYRILKKNGKVVILTPDWVSQMKNFYEDITHCRPYDVSALRDTLTFYSFRNILVERFNQLPILWKVKPLKLISKLLGLFLSVHFARFLTEKTRIKFFRWSVELMILGYGEK